MRRGVVLKGLFLLVLCALGFLLRTTNAGSVLADGGVVFPENDPYYHMRRVFLILAAYPRVPYVDPWMDFPNGAPIVFAPLFDLAIATLAKLAGFGVTDRLQVETIAAFVPPLLGALTCLPVFWIAAQTTSARAAPLAALIAALVPAHIWYSRLGFVDHHVAVTLAQVTMCALVLRALEVGSKAHGNSRRAWFTVLATLSIAAGVLVWNGYLLLVAILDLWLAVLFLWTDEARRREIARLACVIHLGAAALVLPAAIDTVRATGAPLSSVTLSYLHCGVLAAFGGMAALAMRASAWSRSRLISVTALLGLVLAVALVIEPSLLGRTLDWLMRADPFMSSVQESVSILFESDGRLDLAGPQIWMSGFFLAMPLLLVALAYRVVRAKGADEGRLFLLVWGTILFVLTLRQRRFGETFAPALAVIVADYLVELARAIRRMLGRGDVRPALASGLATAVLVLFIVLGFAPYYGGFVSTPKRLVALLEARPELAPQDASEEVRLHRALERFGEIAHAASGSSEPDVAPAGVMNLWPLGHKILYVSRVPVTATPFGSYVGGTSYEDWIDFFLATDETAALEILAKRRSRYVVVDNDLGTIGAAIVGRGENPRDYYGKDLTEEGMQYSFHAPLLRSMYLRLTKLGGSQAMLAAPDGSTEVVPALDHLRLVLDSESDDVIGFPKVYEVVPGANLVVSATPGEKVSLRYEHESAAGRVRGHGKTAVAGEEGEARFVLPYSSERPDLGQTSRWVIEGRGKRREIHVTESDVLEGRVVLAALD